MQFTIGSETFASLAFAAGRFALAFERGAPREDVTLYHVKGVAGSYVSRGGSEGVPLTLCVRYAGADAAAVFAACEASVNSFRESPVTVAGPAGATYPRCVLQQARVVRPPAATGRPGGPAAFMDVEFVFFSAAG